MTEKLNRREFLSLNFESTIGFLGNFIAPQIEVERNFFARLVRVTSWSFLLHVQDAGSVGKYVQNKVSVCFPSKAGRSWRKHPTLIQTNHPAHFAKSVWMCAQPTH